VIRDFTNDPTVYVRQESNLHAHYGHRSLNPARLPNSVTDARHHEVILACSTNPLVTTKCARQELNLHARIGHPGLGRARLPDSATSAMPPLCSSQSSNETMLSACLAALHTD
jgi:hypothetical protein